MNGDSPLKAHPVQNPPEGGLSRARRSARGASAPADADPRLPDACRDMEAIFINHMVSAMRRTVEKSGLIDGGAAEEIYTSLLDAEWAKSMAAAGGLGLARLLEEQLAREESAPPGPETPERGERSGAEAQERLKSAAFSPILTMYGRVRNGQ
jgi:Rod binding domain-containing protein